MGSSHGKTLPGRGVYVELTGVTSGALGAAMGGDVTGAEPWHAGAASHSVTCRSTRTATRAASHGPEAGMLGLFLREGPVRRGVENPKVSQG